MERIFFRNLPSEIITEILSRLPLRSIALSKCVCKRWLNLLDSDDFEFKIPPALALLQQMSSTRCSIFEIEDEEEADLEIRDLHYIQLIHFEIRDEKSEPLADGRDYVIGELSALMDCLCYSYTWEDEIVIWLMKEYHVEESWTILYKIGSNGFDLDWPSGFDWNYMCVKPIKLFKDGDVLMLLYEKWLIYYSNKTRTIQQVGMFKDATAKDKVSAMIFTPSLFSLKNFVFENVISF
ncbi:uncharacterized protein LOC125205113 [Salvia hispanica]|uniref:uncharacterized protein LOC125205113 n=1 Tax=Salvia hispanica TaxID=49212 RepID=UPI002008EF1C|nr:uncharacterized protein LOC125205113 [Salvia hispanica]